MAELAVRELIQASVIDPAALAHAAPEQQAGLHQLANAEPLTAEDALLWYFSMHDTNMRCFPMFWQVSVCLLYGSL